MIYRCSRATLTIAFLLHSAAIPLTCGEIVRGIEGQTITLPCSYKVRKVSDITSMCWGQGSCPKSKCNDVLIWTDGYQVTHRSSDRYHLNDNIARGQISLTISQARMSDAGMYCCRIEHHGWFNDEKKSIQLDMEKAPTTTPPTTTPPTTARRTTPKTTRPPVRKTTPPPKTAKATTPPATTVKAMTLLPTPEIIYTPPPTPARTTIIVPTDKETIETSTVPTAERTTTPQPTPAGSTAAPAVKTTTPPFTTPIDETTTEAKPLSTEPYVICDFSEEMIHPHEAFDHHHPRRTLPSQPAPHSSENGNSDLFSGNITTEVKEESGLAVHMLITAVCVSVIVLVVASLLILKCRGKERGRYLFGLDPNLELVNHAEAPLSETDIEISQTVTLEVDKVEADKPTF